MYILGAQDPWFSTSDTHKKKKNLLNFFPQILFFPLFSPNVCAYTKYINLTTGDEDDDEEGGLDECMID